MSKPNFENSFKHRLKKGEVEGVLALVVCEGEKTEPLYFESLRKEWRLNSAIVRVYPGNRGSNPMSVVRYAKELNEDFQRKNTVIDQTWCVFDQEGINKPKNLLNAIDQAHSNQFQIALSAPSFEIWFLLHFIYTTRDFSSCEEVMKELKKGGYIPNYKKNVCYLPALLPLIDNAKANSRKLRIHCRRTKTECPYTDVDLLVDELQKLKIR